MKHAIFDWAHRGPFVALVFFVMVSVALLPFGLSAESLQNKAAVGDGNRLTYLDDFSNPYYPNLQFPKLTTPQWVGEEGVEGGPDSRDRRHAGSRKVRGLSTTHSPAGSTRFMGTLQ